MLLNCLRLSNFTQFRSTTPRFRFSIGYNDEFDILEKKIVPNGKLKISKIPESQTLFVVLGHTQ